MSLMMAGARQHNAKPIKASWYERFLPFVAKRPAAKIEWLVEVFASRALEMRDITPYIRLLTMEILRKREELAALFAKLDDSTMLQMLAAADVYDAPEIFALIPKPGVNHALIILHKAVPPYEKNEQQVLNRIYQAIYDRSPQLMRDAADALQRSSDRPPHFSSAYTYFEEVLADKQLLQALFPLARKGQPEAD